MHPASAIVLGPGHADFTCCERNHDFTDSRGRVKKCDKTLVASVMTRLIQAKADHLFNGEDDNEVLRARTYLAMKQWFRRGLTRLDDLQDKNKLGTVSSSVSIALADNGSFEVNAFKDLMQWHDGVDDVAAETSGFSLLLYAIMANKVSVVKALLNSTCTNGEKTAPELHFSLPNAGMPEFGLTGRAVPLHTAMAVADWEIVEALLDAGAASVSQHFVSCSPIPRTLHLHVLVVFPPFMKRTRMPKISVGRGLFRLHA